VRRHEWPLREPISVIVIVYSATQDHGSENYEDLFAPDRADKKLRREKVVKKK